MTLFLSYFTWENRTGVLAAIGLLSEAYGLPLFFIIQECSALKKEYPLIEG
jgi:hypothetical protein